MITLEIPASKSITNRALIINAFTNNKCELTNISTARDSQIMLELLNSESKECDVKDAGTVMRFLTSYFAITNQNRILKGTERMHKRPIKILVKTLRSIGAKIDYLENEGYPPVETKSFTSLNACLEMAIDSSISSQYITSILLIAPYLRDGIWLKLDNKVASKPYIEMTLKLMEHFGVSCDWQNGKIKVPAKEYVPNQLEIEPDWSSASYWYSYVSISKNEKILLKGYKKESLQGDSILSEIYAKLGVYTEFVNEGIILSKTDNISNKLQLDCSDFPDLAQTILVTCTYHKINLILTGLESLRIKETDRILAMQKELNKLSVSLNEIESNLFRLDTENIKIPTELFISTYKDHRMAMAFAPLRQITIVKFEDESVVEKSYPTFWDDMKIITKQIQ